MSTARKLVLVFKDDSGASKSVSFNYASSEITRQDVETLMDTIITNNSIFASLYTTKVRADIVVTDTSIIYPEE